MSKTTICFCSNFNRTICKQTVETDQTPHKVASDLGLHCLPMSNKKTLGLYELNEIGNKLYTRKTKQLKFGNKHRYVDNLCMTLYKNKGLQRQGLFPSWPW